jgi:hypothetical protein
MMCVYAEGKSNCKGDPSIYYLGLTLINSICCTRRPSCLRKWRHQGRSKVSFYSSWNSQLKEHFSRCSLQQLRISTGGNLSKLNWIMDKGDCLQCNYGYGTSLWCNTLRVWYYKFQIFRDKRLSPRLERSSRTRFEDRSWTENCKFGFKNIWQLPAKNYKG